MAVVNVAALMSELFTPPLIPCGFQRNDWNPHGIQQEFMLFSLYKHIWGDLYLIYTL